MPDLCPKGGDLSVKPSVTSCPPILPPYLGLPNEQTESQDTHQERAAFVLVEAHTLVLIQNQTIEVREAQTTKTKGEIQEEMKDS